MVHSAIFIGSNAETENLRKQTHILVQNIWKEK